MNRHPLAGIALALCLIQPALAAAATPQGGHGATLRPVHKVDPEFPSEAVKVGAKSGKVTARLSLDASGKVTGVEIVDAMPRRVFDRAVMRALADWRYAEGASGRIVEVEIAFNQ